MADYKAHLHRYLGNGKFISSGTTSNCGRKVSAASRGTHIVDVKYFNYLFNSEDNKYLCQKCLKLALEQNLIK